MIEIPTAVLDREFGREVVRRGRAYADAGSVLRHQLRPGSSGVEVLGSVQGSRPAAYDVAVRVLQTSRGVELWSTCSCPVGLRCKHGVAVLLAARAASGPAEGSGWAGDLDAALAELERHPPAVASGPTPLAVQVELKVTPARWRSQPVRAVRLRPVQRGKLGAWIKTGVDWPAVPGLRYRGEHDPAQAEALAELATVIDPVSGGAVGRAGMGLWSVLARLEEAGVPLVPGPGVGEIEVCAGPATVAADVRADGDALLVSFGVVVAERSWDAEEVEPFGSPAVHGVALLRASDPAETGRGARPGGWAVTLAPLARTLPAPVRTLLDRREPLVVPAADRGTFEEDYLPRLRRQLSAVSSDGTVRLPDEPVPRLVLELEWLAPGRATGGFSWCYGTGVHERRYALDSGAGLVDVRRPDAEQALLARLALDEAARELLCDAGGRLRAEQDWTGRRLLRFVEEVLPGLRGHPDVTVEETGEQPDYREATGDPEVSFTLVDPAGPAEPARGEEPPHTDWLDLEVMIRVDGRQLALGIVVTALTRGEERIFLPDGLYVRADHPAFARLTELVAAAGELADQPPDGLRVARRDLGAWAELDELGVVDEQAATWVRAARALRDANGLPEVTGVGLASELRGYQRDGLRWLALLWQARLGGILADDMGLGKTLQALAAIAHARAHGAAPFLVVAPTSVVGAWASEAARHAPDLDVRTVTATAARRDRKISELAETADVVVTSYTLLRLEAEDYAALDWGGLVLDEAQQVKNHRSKLYRAVRQIDAPFRLALTGTPFENRLMELWSLLSVVAPGLYPSPQGFRESVVRRVERGDADALDRFRRRIRPFLLRRTKELVAADMPPKQEQLLPVSLAPRHRRIYDTHLQRERQAVLGLVEDFDRHRMAIFRSLTRLRQLSLDAALLDPAHEQVASAKIDVLVEHLHELVAEGHRALVFSQFTSFLKRVRARLQDEGIASCYLDGRTRDRSAAIEEFRTGEAPAFLISLKAGGVGLTLTEADYVFVLDPWWNPAVEAQAVDRAHRIGQHRPVMVYRLVATDTIEEKVVALKERKAALFAQVMDGGAGVDGTLVADDVRALFDG